jgi:hypothetical protein
MSDERSVYPRFIVPTWPGEPFMLIAERGKFEYGPFDPGDFAVSEDNALYYSDGASHPIQLRVSLQVGDVLFANNGDVGPMTYRIVAASAYDPRADEIGALNFDDDPLAVIDRLATLTRFIDRHPIALTLAGIQDALQPLTAEGGGDLEAVTPEVLEGALIAAERFARLGDVIRTTAIVLLLPELLEPGEELVAVSTSGTSSSSFDIETDRRVGCLRLTRWARAGDDRNGLVCDLVKLVAEPSPRRAELYVLGEWAEHVLGSDVPIGAALGRSSVALQWFMTHFGDLSIPIQDFWDGPGAQVSIIDIGPTLSRLVNPGPRSAGDSVPGCSDE